MRVLQIHNKYKSFGGEDVLLQSEFNLLKENGHAVEQLFFDNKTIEPSFFGKLNAGIKSIYNFKSARVVQHAISTFKPDIIHVQNFFPILSPAVFYVANRNNVPVVTTINNYRLICSNATLLRDNHLCVKCVNKVLPLSGVAHKCYHNSHFQSAAVTLMSSVHKLLGTWRNRIDMYIIAMTEFGKETFITSSLKLPPEKCTLKPNFVVDMGFGSESREDFYLCFARLSEEKGIRVLLDSLHHYKYKLKIVGDGPLRPIVEQAVKENTSIEFLGFKNIDWIIAEVKKSRAVIMPSIWYEALPLSVLHTLSTGTPLIISDLPPFRELIADKINGFHFKTGDSVDLARKIEFLNQNYDQMKVLYKNARETYLEKYTPERNYLMLIEIYERLLKSYRQKKKNFHKLGA
ncbi:MAG: glycosyltransferase family 4 protein [Cytophagales bacterium]|nr:glycosyltransferase family 4 protein [Cytophagales bacterium]MCZ8068828.1 glycosyltransferase family 4 protein [Cytophagales bacterium]